MRSRSQGFTVIEAMVVVGIIAILAGFAAPAMNQLIRTQKVRSISYDLFADLTYARSEAIARGHNVEIASKSGNDWGGSGWSIRDLATGEQLRDQSATSKGASIRDENDRRRSSFEKPTNLFNSRVLTPYQIRPHRT